MQELISQAQSWLDRVDSIPGAAAAIIIGISFILAKIVDFAVCRSLLRLSRFTKSDLDNQVVAQLHRPIFVSVVLAGTYFAVQTVSMPASVMSGLTGLIHTVAIFVWSGACLRIVSTVVTGLNAMSADKAWVDGRTLPLLDNLAKVVIMGGAVYCLLLAWNLDVKPWLASAGIAGIAIGFAAKDTLANLFGGIFVIADSPYKVGDFINLDSGERGRVIQIGLRSTRLLTRDDVEVTGPNAQIANSTIVNESGGPYEKTRVAILAGVEYGSDVDEVKRILLEAAQSVDIVTDDPAPRVRFQEMGDSALIFRTLCWVDEPVLRGQCIDQVNTAVYKALNAAEINIPFPQRDIHIKGRLS